jgi:hypothetical protein
MGPGLRRDDGAWDASVTATPDAQNETGRKNPARRVASYGGCQRASDAKRRYRICTVIELVSAG